MHVNHAAVAYGKFHSEKFLPAVEEALEDGRLDGELADDLIEAIRISRSVGPSATFGKTMLGEVLFTILFESLPKPKKNKKEKSQ